MQPLDRFENFELVISPGAAAAGNLNFKDVQILRSDPEKDCIILGIELFGPDVLANTFNQNPQPTLAQVQTMFLNIYHDGENSINNIPVVTLSRTYQKGSATQAYWQSKGWEFDKLQIDWTKTTLNFTPFVIAAQVAMMFGFTYKYLAPGTMNAVRARRALAQAQGVGLF